MPLVKISADHQIVLPKELMTKLGISVGDYLEMNERGDQIVMRSVKPVSSDQKFCKDISKGGKWSQAAERLSAENLLDKGTGEILRKASREFRKNFGFREPPHFEETKE